MSFLDPLKRVARLKNTAPRRTADKDPQNRIPPSQYLSKKFPVLTYGETPRIDLKQWRLEIGGLVEDPLLLNWAGFTDLPTVKIQTDIHCVTRWSVFDTVWEGVPFGEILERVKPKPRAGYVMQHAYGGYTTNVPLSALLKVNVLLAYKFDGMPLPVEHGGPMRLLVPDLYFWKSAKWLNRLEFMDRDHAGFWEQYGYHNNGDPWKEERFG